MINTIEIDSDSLIADISNLPLETSPCSSIASDLYLNISIAAWPTSLVNMANNNKNDPIIITIDFFI